MSLFSVSCSLFTNGMNLDSLISLYNTVPTDWILIGVFAIFAAFDSLRAGARRISALALALPIATLLSKSVTDSSMLSTVVQQFSTPTLQALLFGLLLVAAYIIVQRIGLVWTEVSGQTIQAALGGVAITALVVTFWLEVPSLQTLWHFSPQVQEIFGESYRFWWLAGSFGVLAFIRS